MKTRRATDSDSDASAAHRRMADAMWRPPSRGPLPDAPDTSWRGTLDLLPDGGLLGELQDQHRWTLQVVGTMQGRDAMALRLWVRTPGLVLVAHDDHALRSDLTERLDASWPWGMERAAGDRWQGAVAGLSWRLVVTGARVGAGRLELVGDGERVTVNE